MSKQSQNSLVEIPAESFSVLRDKFKVGWPKHIAAFSLFNTFAIRSAKSLGGRRVVKVFSLNGKWEDGTFIVMFDTNVSFGTLDPTFDRLKTALKLLNFDRVLMFMCIPEFYFSMFDEVIEELDLIKKFDIPGTMMTIERREAMELNYEIPQGFKLDSLTERSAEAIKVAWTHGEEFSGETVAYLIENNPSVGLFNEAGELVAWCLVFDFGSLAALQVDEEYQRRGFGEIVTRAITKKVAKENDVDVTSNFVDGNLRSQRLVEKIGYKKIDTNRWIGVCSGSQ